MKTKLTILKRLAILCGTLATTAAFGQTVHTWTGVTDGINISTSGNWNPSGAPNGGTGDIAQWDGVTTSNLTLNCNTGIGNSTPGLNFLFTVNQVNSVGFVSTTAASGTTGLSSITNNGTGAVSIGDGTANVLNLAVRSPGTTVNFAYVIFNEMLNNSASPATIYPNVKWVAGGGNAHTFAFDGTGDWLVTNGLTMANGTGQFVRKYGSGKLTWAGPSIAGAAGNSTINSPVDIEGGTLLLASSGLLGTQRITNNATLQYGAAAAQTLSGPIDGTGLLVVSAGTLTLSSTLSDFSGNIMLTNSGVLVAGGNQNGGPTGTGPLGTNNTVIFGGGTLQFSAANTFDYSPRFSTAASQAYKFDTGGQNVTFNNSLTSSSGTLTKLGSGTLTLTGANTYSGTTAVGAGKLIIQSTAGSGAIIVSNSTALGVSQGGIQIAPSSLTVGTSAGATLEFNNVSITSTAAIAASGTVTAPAGSPITVNVNSGSFSIGQDYPLFSWGSGPAPAVTLGTLTGAGGTLNTNGNTIRLHITSLAFVWTGGTDGNWDITTLGDWKVNGVSQAWNNGGTALFDDTMNSANTNVTVNFATIQPASTTVNSSTKTYSIASSGANFISTGTLTKNGNSTLTLSGGLNTYSGATTISGGTVTVGALADGGSASDIGAAGNGAANLVLNGGTLQYTGAFQSSDRLFTLGTGNGAIDASGSDALNLSNPGLVAMSGSGARTLTLKGNSAADNTLSAVLSDNGGATALAKSGAGKWILAANNTNSGTVTIAAGTLQAGTGGASGTLGSGNVVDNGTLIFNTTSTVTNGTITGTGSVDLEGSGTIVLPGNNTYSGGTTVNNGTLQIGTGGVTGSLYIAGSIMDNGLVIFNTMNDVTITGFNVAINGSGNLITRGSGLTKITGNNTYSGWTLIDPGAQLQVCEGQTGANTSSVITNNGTLIMAQQNASPSGFTFNGPVTGTGKVVVKVTNGNPGDSTLTGSNDWTGNTFILGGRLILGDNATPGSGAFTGNVFLTNDYVHNQFGIAPNDFVPATLTFNRVDDFTFPGTITGPGFVTFNGSATVTLTGNNTYTGGGNQIATTINAGTVQVGNGGTSGSLGATNVANNSVLVFNRSDSVSFAGVISGTGSLVQMGSGQLTLGATNTYTGSTTVSNGTLVVTGGSLGGNVNVEGGTFVPASLSTGGSLNVGGSMAIDAGTVLVPLNNSLTVTNINVAGALSFTGGSLVVTNAGPALVVSNKFYIFSQPVSGLTVSGAGATWQNDLAVDGSITALTVTSPINPLPPRLQFALSGNNLSLGWPTNLGWILQTNAVGLLSPASWFAYPGSTTITNVNITVDPRKANVFFRMLHP